MANEPPTPEIPPRKQDAIHRALLTGLLGHVGNRGEGHEYAGVRGTRFHLFPGSSLFRRRPPWVMSAELVETTRLYARTVAPVHPLWIERAAAHLVRRTYADPHWRPDVGRVLAYERVTLHGLTLIDRRKVHYGPIDPRLSREVLIHHALVLGEYETNAPFFLHNQRLVRDVQAIEAKARRRDVLVDAKARFAFYDARVPQRIYTAHEFERWRRQAEARQPRLLFMSPGDLMLHPALGVSAELYPDVWTTGQTTFALDYLFEPGDRADGITLTVPLAALNTLNAATFDWLVPGFRPEMFVALIRTLPKSLRVKFVPVPAIAAAAARELRPTDGPVLAALADYLGRTSGEPVRPADLHPDALPEHLRMNYRVIDGAGREVAAGRNLGQIRRQLGLRARASFAAAPPPPFDRDQIVRWDFGDLPARIEIEHDGLTLNGYPALVDTGVASVSLRLFDAPDAAAEAMRGGVRRLFMIQLRRELEEVERHRLGDLERLCLYYAPVGRCDDLREDLLTTIADRALFDDEPDVDVRSQAAFARLAEAGWRRLAGAADEVADLAARTLEAHHALNLSLARDVPPLWSDSIDDMRDQLAHLVYRGFLVRTPYAWLRHLPRYLQAIESRLQKLGNAGLTRDRLAMDEVRPAWLQYKRRAAQRNDDAARDPLLEQYRWMIEELRVSLFAQELKTAIPISAARLQKAWEAMAP